MSFHFSIFLEDLINSIKIAAKDIGIKRIAIVGGVIRDQIIGHQIQPKDLDICIEGSASALAKKIENNLGKDRVSIIRINEKYCTVEMQIDKFPIDIASARKESYPSPGKNPNITLSTLSEDLGRRDFTINSMALDLSTSTLIDLYNSKHDISSRQLEFIHSKSVEEDPTRIVRGARYAGRLNFNITTKSLEQIKSTIKKWPWDLAKENGGKKIPPALGTRLKMELELLFKERSYNKAIKHLQDWGALALLDQELQNDQNWEQRLDFALGLDISPLTAFIAKSPNSTSLAKRLQLPQKDQNILAASLDFQNYLLEIYKSKKYSEWKPSRWCQAIENESWHPDVVAIVICLQHPLWKPCLEWLRYWRRIDSPLSAKELIKQGWIPGPLLKEELQRLRFQKLDRLY